MINEFKVENYKSIESLDIKLGRVTVFIGENGCGKSNILEAIALGAAAASNRLDNEFLTSRGVRITSPQFMRSAFDRSNLNDSIKLHFTFYNEENFSVTKENFSITYELVNDNKPYSKWKKQNVAEPELMGYPIKLDEIIKKLKTDEGVRKALINRVNYAILSLYQDFLIYSPENTSLRTFEKEGQIQPLGIYGEGLFKLLRVFSLEENHQKLKELKNYLKLIDWFKDFNIPEKLFEGESYVKVVDRYLDKQIESFDQRSSNEGFLFLLFYFSLFISNDTPDFFAIDNIEASLNPKLCSQLTKNIVELSKKYEKQVIITTHNPAILDGLNIEDDEQRLFVIYRNKFGHTKAQRVSKKHSIEGQEPVKLSEAFIRGYIGGLPKNF